MENYLFSSYHKRELEQQREILELKKENTLLKGVISDYREGLAGMRAEVENSLINKQKEQVSQKKKATIPLWNLTNSEREVLNILLVQKENAIDRHSLAIKIWGNCDSASYMTRISTIIKNLRAKLRIKGSDQDVIKTSWGEGYHLTEKFFSYYEIDDHFMKEYEEAQ